MQTIPVLDATDKLSDISAALIESGAVVIRSMTDASMRAAIIKELEPFLANAPVSVSHDKEDFYPGHTRRLTALLKKSKSVRPLVVNPILTGCCDVVLKPNCERYHLHVSSALVIGPGAREQILHREEDPFNFFEAPRPNMVLASMWAMTDFTRANGATNIVPGSHLWDASRSASRNEIVPAEMKAGDMLVWMGGTLHGGGANISEDWRYGVFISYSLGWLRQEENQYLDVPLELAKTFPKELRALVGYTMHGGLGFYEPEA